MHFHDYIISNNSERVRDFLVNLGYRYEDIEADPARCVAHYISNHDDITPLLKLHPDLDMLQEVLPKPQQPKVIAHPATMPQPKPQSKPLIGERIQLPITQNDLINIALILACAYLLLQILKK